ncbi:MAG: hypothetical protein KGH88_02185, partial [Thaumarchaeota archaeon]|nr:hypothetical protein [Nitrososphaerota archaeon]
MTAVEELIVSKKKTDLGADQVILKVEACSLMSEELTKKGYEKTGTIIGNYEYFDLADTTINQLKRANIIPKKDYGKYGKRKPDGLLIDRQNQRI